MNIYIYTRRTTSGPKRTFPPHYTLLAFVYGLNRISRAWMHVLTATNTSTPCDRYTPNTFSFLLLPVKGFSLAAQTRTSRNWTGKFHATACEVFESIEHVPHIEQNQPTSANCAKQCQASVFASCWNVPLGPLDAVICRWITQPMPLPDL